MTSALRKKILSLAIRGKLVPQDPSDEPAVVLLERIRTERAANESATPPRGRGRRSSSDNPPCPKSGKSPAAGGVCDSAAAAGLDGAASGRAPFPIPKSWAWTTLGNTLASLHTGLNPRRFFQLNTADAKYYYVTIREIKNNRIVFSQRTDRINESALTLCNKRSHLEEGDVLFGGTGTIGAVALVESTPTNWNIKEGVYALKPLRHLLSSKFLLYLLQEEFIRKTYLAKAVGATVMSVPMKELLSIPIPLPPLAEQKRIVARLDELQRLCDGIDKDNGALQDLAAKAKARILDLAIRGALVPQDPANEPASALLSRIRATADKPPCPKREKNAGALGISSSPFPIPESWEWTTLGEVCDYGKCETVDAATVVGETWSLDLEDIEKGSGRLISRVRASERPAFGTRHSFRAGHVLYSKLRTYLNKVLVADEDGVCSSEILPLDFRGLVQPGYARFVLMSSMFLDYAARCGYGVKMPRLGTADGRNGPFPLPPLAEQRRIVEKVEELFSAIDAMVTT